MGGWGSGGGRNATKTNDMLRIDLARLRELGMLQMGRRSNLVWSRGSERVGQIFVERRERALILDYRSRENGGEWQAIREAVPLEFTAQHLGGARAWFKCLGCRRRCRVIYGGKLFRCRRCYRLVYPSQFEDGPDRIITRTQNLRMRLGGDGGMDTPFPPKPKWMRWKTYRRLELQDDQACAIFAAIFLGYEMRGLL